MANFHSLFLILLLFVFQSDAYTLDTKKLMTNVKKLCAKKMAGRSRRESAKGSENAEKYIVNELKKFGLSTVKESINGKKLQAYCNKFPDLCKNDLQEKAGNIIATIPGTKANAKVIILVAHYDHLGPKFPGADDNASGVSLLMELARYIKSNPLEATIKFIFTDVEESGLHGGYAYVEDHASEVSNVATVVNFDMVSVSKKFMTVVGCLDSRYKKRNEVACSVVDDKLGKFGKKWELVQTDKYEKSFIDASDHWPFLQGGYPALYFGVPDHKYYHSRKDKPNVINTLFYNDFSELAIDFIIDLSKKMA